MDSLTEVDDEDIQAFLIEGHDILNGMEQSILSFESTSNIDPQQFNQLYRGLHTLKGNCGFLPFPTLEAIAHSGETLLDTLRSRQQNFTSDIATILLQAIDSIRTIFQTIQATGKEGKNDYSALRAQLTALSQSQVAATEEEKITLLDPQFSEPEPSSTDSTIRVSIDLLDRLMNLVGELVLARNRMLQLSTLNQDASLLATSQHINFVTNELQDSVMRSRMQPIQTLWRSLPRMIRDLSLSCGKSVQLELEGEDTELDRSLIAALKDPLTHLIRNCVDHGIEPPEMRSAMGKPTHGTIKLRAFQESGKINLELHDDGRGIDPSQLKLKSQQLGLISTTQADAMSDREAFELMFLPGFSTATEVTRLSGRGVGMDVVRRSLESVNGTVSVESELRKGTTFCLKIPLTLAIISALLVTSGNEQFSIPQASIQELVRIEGTEVIKRSIEHLLGVPVYKLRGQILPLIDLNQVLELPTTVAESELLHIVVITADRYRFGLIVDAIEDTQEIVVKPLSKQLRSLTMFTGATVLGDGTVSLILDVIGLAQYAEIDEQQTIIETAIEEDAQECQLVLLVKASQGSPMGILMTQATRLESIPINKIEQVGEQFLMQYRDLIVSLIDLPALLSGVPRLAQLNQELDDHLWVVVITLEDRTIGLIVDAIVDIVEASLGVTSLANRPGVQYYATVKGQITEILDLREIVELANPHQGVRARTLTRQAIK